MKRIFLLTFLLTFLVACAVPVPPFIPRLPLPNHRPLTLIAFGSCANQSKPQPIWDAVTASRPDLFIFLGDNIYGDTEDMNLLRARYAQLGQNPGYQRLRTATPVIATWDDHDYGANDAGAEYPKKQESKQIFLDFFGEPITSERRQRDDGIYTAYGYGPVGQRVQVILLDTRWNRSPLARVSEADYNDRRAQRIGPYTATTDPNAQLLGEAQWQWLAAQLRQPAELRLLATSIPFLQEGTGWEIWANFPGEQQRLLALLEETQANGVIFITGDTHRAQFSKRTTGVPYPLWEVNSSGLTENVDWPAPDSSRLGGYYTEDNYGLLRIDWREADPEITMEIRAVDNDLVLQNSIRLSEVYRQQQ
ncbi:MAG: alkaline phosphatase family protein [Caldilinea sp. CFX5]|nr:alkaline phosphatase family protein [Caldilinea sp. CFX5]